jgi:hypothetical protein
MKILGVIFAALILSGCTKTMAVSTWNMGMSIVAPGSYSTAYNSSRDLILRMSNYE